MRSSKYFFLISSLLIIISFFLIQNTIVRKQFYLNEQEQQLLFNNIVNVKDVVNDSSGYPVKLKVNSNSLMTVFYDDSLIFSSDSLKFGSSFLKNIDNTSYKSALYSLGFLRNHLIVNGLEGIDVTEMDKLVLDVINLAESFTTYDVYINHDHPVSERLETLILYISYKNNKGYYVSQKETEHVKHLITLLMDKDFFSYHMNHGLMQIRALLRVGIILKNDVIINQAKEYIFDVLPIYISNDGSILESAFGYQYYIFLQFDMLNKLLLKLNDDSLDQIVNKQKYYINSLISSNGFLQGTGDSYNQFVNRFYNQDSIGYYNLFHFENEVSGMSSLDKKFMMFFISLDNKPNVHKLQEDLGLYIYYDKPFIINSGTYSYESKDSFRKEVLGKNIQNGPKFHNGNIKASSIESMQIKGDSVVFKGVAILNNQEILREVVFRNKNVIDIIDFSKYKIVSAYIIHPDIKVNFINEFSLELCSDKESILVQSSKPFSIDSVLVSDRYKSTIKTLKLSVNGNSKVSFHLPEKLNVDVPSLSVRAKENHSTRQMVIDKLKKKYPIILVVKKVFVSYAFLSISLILIFFGFLFKKKFFSYILVMFSVLLAFNLFTGGKLVVYILYFINSLR